MNYNQYLLKNDEQKMSNLCKFCNKNFSRKYNLQRHESVCKLTISQQKIVTHKTQRRLNKTRNTFSVDSFTRSGDHEGGQAGMVKGSLN